MTETPTVNSSPDAKLCMWSFLAAGTAMLFTLTSVRACTGGQETPADNLLPLVSLSYLYFLIQEMDEAEFLTKRFDRIQRVCICLRDKGKHSASKIGRQKRKKKKTLLGAMWWSSTYRGKQQCIPVFTWTCFPKTESLLCHRLLYFQCKKRSQLISITSTNAPPTMTKPLNNNLNLVIILTEVAICSEFKYQTSKKWGVNKLIEPHQPPLAHSHSFLFVYATAEY